MSTSWARPETPRESEVPDGGDHLRRLTHLALYVAAATVLFVLERLIPNPLPWVRLGLANAVTLLVLVRLGAAAALWVQSTRLVLAGLLTGSLLGPTCLLAVSGGIASWLVMAGMRRFLAPWFSLLGISVLGAVAHVATQIAVVATLFHAGVSVLSLLPVFLGSALVTGACIGLVTEALVLRLTALRPAERP